MNSNEAMLAIGNGNSTAEVAGRAVPPLKTLYFYLTEGCNLRCRHCWIEPPHQSAKRQYRNLDLELFRSILWQAKPLGLSSVKLTGGEPLMHPRIGDILGILREETLDLSVETNGVFCGPELAHDLQHSNLRHISVSLDGADADTHEWIRGVKGCFDEAISGIRNLVAAGIRPQVIMTLMRKNVEQIDAVVRLAESLGASSVKFNIVQPTARGLKMHQAGETLTIEELMTLGDRVENSLSCSATIPLYYSHPAAFRPLGKLYGRNGGGCAVCSIHSIIGVLADGSYALCGIGETIRELIFGHASQDRLENVWSRHPVLREIREGLPRRLEGICGDCVMKGICLGSCIAQNYFTHGRLWAGFWFCEEAHKKGLFPLSRQAVGRKPQRREDHAVTAPA